MRTLAAVASLLLIVAGAVWFLDRETTDPVEPTMEPAAVEASPVRPEAELAQTQAAEASTRHIATPERVEKLFLGAPGSPSDFYVRVLAEDGTPLVGAEVGARAENARTTDADGYVCVEIGPWLLVRREGFTSGAVPFEGSHRTPQTARVVRLRPTSSLIVDFVDTTGRPVPGYSALASIQREHTWPDSVYVNMERYRSEAPLQWSAAADEEGSAVLESLPTGIPIEVRAQGDDARAVTLVPGEEKRLQVVVDVATRITGRVWDEDGRPADGAVVVVVPRWSDEKPNGSFGGVPHSKAGEDGRYDILGVEPGNYWLTHGGSSRPMNGLPPPSFAIDAVAADVNGDVPVLEVDLCAWKDTAISGVVVADERSAQFSEDDPSTPLDWVNVEIRGIDRPIHMSHVLMDEGSFRTGPLLPGRYLLRAGQYGEPVEAKSGDTSVTLPLRPRYQLRGKLVPPGPVTMNSVQITRRKDPWGLHSFQGTGIDSEGRFEIVLDEGPYTLSANYENGDFARLDVDVTATTGEVLLSPITGVKLTLHNDLSFPVDGSLTDASLPFASGSLSAGESVTVEAPYGKVLISWVNEERNRGGGGATEVPEQKAFAIALSEVEDF